MALERDIHNLLFAHDCVIVPGFGGFLTHYRPARLDTQRQVVHPPAKDLSFNKNLTRTDGLLAQELMRRKAVDHAAATRMLTEQTQEWRNRLARDGRLELDRVGTFFHDQERNLQFTPDARVNFLRDAYGLRSVAAIPVLTVVPEQAIVAPIVAAAATAAPTTAVGSGGRWRWAAAAALVAATLGIWWLVGVPEGSLLALDKNQPDPRYHAPEQAHLFRFPSMDTAPWAPAPDAHGIRKEHIAGENAPAVAVDHGKAPEHQVPVAKAESTAVAVRHVDLRYHIIGGCFKEKENADRFAAELQARGFAARVIDRKGGLYRVAYGSYAEKAMAREALEAVRREGAQQAWLLVR